MHILTDKFEKHKKQLYFVLAVTFIWGMLAHAYCFFNNCVSHDSLNEFHAAILGNDWKIQLGRFFTPVYRDLLRSDATLPWLIGALSLLWIGLAVFFVVRIFEIETKTVIVFTAGIFATNITVSATAATYIMDLDCNMFSLLCSVLAVYCWKCIEHGELLGAGFILVSLGIYQAYLSVSIVLVLFVCILWLFQGKHVQFVFLKGLKAIGMIILGGILYLVAMKAIAYFSGNTLSSGESNSLDKVLELTPQTVLFYVVNAYANCFERLFCAHSAYPAIMVKGTTAVLLLIILFVISVWLFSKKVGILEKIFGMILIALLPLAMNIFHVLTLGNTHDLMVFAVWLFYLLALLLCEWLVKNWKQSEKNDNISRFIRILCILLVFFTVYGSVQFANGMYMKKDLEYDAYLSMMTRIVSKMEDYEGYIPGETPVVFVGIPKVLSTVIPGFKEYRTVIGMATANVISVPVKDRYQAYFDYILALPLLLADWETWNAIVESDMAATIPCYPSEDFITMSGNVMVIKLGNIEE